MPEALGKLDSGLRVLVQLRGLGEEGNLEKGSVLDGLSAERVLGEGLHGPSGLGHLI